MAEAAQDHQLTMERTIVTAGTAEAKRGQWFAFILALIGIGVGAGLIFDDKSVQGFGVLIIDVGVMAGYFLKTSGGEPS